jgi:hypothetical protein
VFLSAYKQVPKENPTEFAQGGAKFLGGGMLKQQCIVRLEDNPVVILTALPSIVV